MNMTQQRHLLSTRPNVWIRVAIIAAAVAIGILQAQRMIAQSQEPPRVDLVITSSPGVQTRYAVPDFVAATPDLAETARTLAEVLWNDLEFEREFYMIPRDTYSSIPRVGAGALPPFPAWRELGADALVSGSVEKVGDLLRVDFRLYRINDQQQVLAARYEANARNPRLLAHRISDEIFLKQRNLKGVARTKLAFISDRNREPLVGTVEKREVKEVYISDYDGANEQRITVSRGLNLNPSWSPDANAIAYSSSNSRTGADIVVSRIYEGLLQRPAKGIGNNYLPSFSPDGKRVAFASTRDGNMEIYIVNVDGSALRRLTNNPADDLTPTWSPSGDQIAFVSDRTGRPQVYAMGVDGVGLRLISQGETHADRPTWSPAPFNEIAFTAQRGGWFDVKIFDAAAGTSRWLTDNRATGGSNESPAFSPTGRHLAFMSTRTRSMQIFVIGRDGRGERQITRSGNNQTPSWSPN
jgi:TolB protein